MPIKADAISFNVIFMSVIIICRKSNNNIHGTLILKNTIAVFIFTTCNNEIDKASIYPTHEMFFTSLLLHLKYSLMCFLFLL